MFSRMWIAVSLVVAGNCPSRRPPRNRTRLRRLQEASPSPRVSRAGRTRKSQGDKRIYTASSAARKDFTPGLPAGEVEVAKAKAAAAGMR
ncbi:MAG: hypothetical protein U0791_14130 [Gemmataceae bacterium]